MIKHCPICGMEEGLTHGDQIWKDEICKDCMEWKEAQENEKNEMSKLHDIG